MLRINCSVEQAVIGLSYWPSGDASVPFAASPTWRITLPTAGFDHTRPHVSVALTTLVTFIRYNVYRC